MNEDTRKKLEQAREDYEQWAGHIAPVRWYITREYIRALEQALAECEKKLRSAGLAP